MICVYIIVQCTRLIPALLFKSDNVDINNTVIIVKKYI